MKIAIISFPGNNCEVESMRAIKRVGMEPVFHKWNDDIENLKDIDGYFLPGGFSYEDRGRAGMISARDPIMDFLREEATKGKVIIGNCNGAQILVESGLIPNADGLQMSLARNASGEKSLGFLGEWIWVTPTCDATCCATSNWTGAMHMPIAHGEGRFTTKDPSVWQTLKDNNQIAFSYCDETGDVIDSPNGSEFSAAGVCNPEGNVVALMPHPERTENGGPYFVSMKQWIDSHPPKNESSVSKPACRQAGNNNSQSVSVSKKEPEETEIFIDTIIVNNEERTVEKAAQRLIPHLKLKQLRYKAVSDVAAYLSHIANFNPNKERAFIRRGEVCTEWDADDKREVEVDSVLREVNLLRTDEPSSGTSVCYACSGVSEEEVLKGDVLEIFGNPHASLLQIL